MFFFNTYTLHTFIYRYALELSADLSLLLTNSPDRDANTVWTQSRVVLLVSTSVSSSSAATAFLMCRLLSTQYEFDKCERGVGFPRSPTFVKSPIRLHLPKARPTLVQPSTDQKYPSESCQDSTNDVAKLS